MIIIKTLVLILAMVISLAYVADIIETIIQKKSSIPYMGFVVSFIWGYFIT